MQNSLSQLIELQHIDSDLMEIEELKGDLPAQVDRLIRDLENLRQSIFEKGQRREEIHQERSLLESSLEESRQHLKKYQDQLMLVSTNRAYDALMTEIDTAKKTIENGEFHLLELAEEDQRTAEELKSAELTVEEKKVRLKSQRKSLRITIAETEAQARALQKQRERLRTALEPRHMQAYERLRAARDGLAVVPISRGSCGVCYNRIPAQRQVEIKAGNRIITCDSCGVILYWDGE